MPPVTLSTHKTQDPITGDEIEIRGLSVAELRAARAAEQERAQRTYFALIASTPPETLALLESQRGEQPSPAPEDPTDPDLYDAGMVLRAGIVSWGYVNADGSPYPCTPDTRVTLDGTTGRHVAAEILKLSARAPGETHGSASS